MQATDLQLIRKARAGDGTAFHTLVDRHANRLYMLAYSLVGNSADAEDIVQEAFVAAFRHLRLFREEASVKTWLTRIVVKQSAKCHRWRKRHRTLPIEAAESFVDGLGNAGDKEKRFEVMETLNLLPAKFREIIVLRELEGYTYDEIANILRIPRGTVESRLFRARKMLKNKFGTAESD